MNEKTKLYIEVGGTAVALAALFVFIRGQNATASAVSAATPNPELANSAPETWSIPDYLSYNVPKSLASATAIPESPLSLSMSSPAPAATCGCATGSGSLSGSLFSSFSSLAAYYNSQLQNLESNYTKNLESAIPDFVKQFFNNPVAALQSQTSASTLSNSFQKWQGSAWS